MEALTKRVKDIGTPKLIVLRPMLCNTLDAVDGPNLYASV